jgi:hypothetical protein
VTTQEDDAEDQGGSRFPFIPLKQALDRARTVHKNAGDHPVSVPDLIGMWEYAPKSSGWKQTIAALRYYGLLNSSGVKEGRRLKLTEDARRYFLDERPEEHAKAHKKFALSPPALAKLWGLWHDSPPSDQIARSTLKLDFNYDENPAAQLLSIYKANLVFAGLVKSGADSVSESDERSYRRAQADPISHRSPDTRHAEASVPSPAATQAPLHPPRRNEGVRLMEGERVVFTEEGRPGQYLKLIASEDFDDTMLEALEDFVKRQRKRLEITARYNNPEYVTRRQVETERRASQTDDNA